uniref:Uncharacterized protein n=1 Tax=Lepeophtheirus salmonis TaxID=72036 RepID=A0A0K2UKE4_LEPSM
MRHIRKKNLMDVEELIVTRIYAS